MNSFDRNKKLEEKALFVMLPWIARISRGRYELYENADKQFQKSSGDLRFLSPRTGKWLTVELKVEERNAHGNFFLETFSNKDPRQPNPGWMHTSAVDLLWYYFLESDDLYAIHRPELYRWFFGDGEGAGAERRYPERTQKRHAQANLTAGRIVPIRDVEAAVGYQLLHPVQQRLAVA